MLADFGLARSIL